MIREKKKSIFYLLIIVFIIWFTLVSHWYVCQLKGFCDDSNNKIVKKDIHGEVIKNNPKNERYPENIVLPKKEKVVKQKVTCTPYLKRNIIYGGANDLNEVAKLEKFLNEKEGENLKIDGIYQKNDREAVKRFQEKYYSREVQKIGGLITKVDGIVGPETLKKINLIYCVEKTKEYFDKKNK